MKVTNDPFNNFAHNIIHPMELRLLFLDDDLIQNEIFSEYLTLFDIPYEAQFLVSGISAIEYLKNCPAVKFPQVFFIDLMMPRMNGWEFLDELKKIMTAKSVMPNIYLLTSSVSKVDKIKAKKYIILKDFITKPLAIKRFQKLLQDEYALQFSADK